MRARVLTLGLVLLASGAATAAVPGPWVWPVDGTRVVSRAFAPPQTRYGPGHRGADLPGQPGQPVGAAGSGRISYAGLLAGRGVVVVVHGNLRTTYEPVAAVVRVGEQVAAGQVIGRLRAGHDGCAPACLHWGLLRGEVYLDPVRLVRRGPSRLLPVPQVGSGGGAADRPSTTRRGPVPASTGRASGQAAPTAVPVAASPPDAPLFALRAGDAASAGGALLALLAGLLLLRRPPRPPEPVAPALGTAVRQPDAAALAGDPQLAGLVDLTSERQRRRPEVA